MNYEKYCKDMRKFKQVPMDEVAFNLMMNIGEERIEPLVITPRNQAKPMKPTMDNHSKIKNVIKRIHLPKFDSEPKPKIEPKEIKQPKSNRAKPTDLMGMTKEEKEAHHKAKALERYYAKRSPTVRVKMSDEERKEKKRIYNNKRRKNMIDSGTWKRKPLTDEQKEKARKLKEEARRKAGIQPRTKMSPEEKKAKLLQQSAQWRQRCKEKGIKRVLTDEQRERYNANYRAKAKLKKEQK